MFTITGRIAEQTCSVTYTWKDGEGRLEGDPVVLFLMRSQLEREKPCGPAGIPLERDLSEPLAAYCMICDCFDSILSREGEIPAAGKLPEGALG